MRVSFHGNDYLIQGQETHSCHFLTLKVSGVLNLFIYIYLFYFFKHGMLTSNFFVLLISSSTNTGRSNRRNSESDLYTL